MRYEFFKVDPAFVTEGTIRWTTTGNGEYIIGTRRGRRFFIKRNIHVIMPIPDMSEDTFAYYKPKAEQLEKKQTRLRELMSGLNWETDHIVAEEMNFWDDSNKYVTVTACIPDPLPDDFSYPDLRKEEFLQLAQETTQAIALLHEHKVIHGDLKEKNIIVAKRATRYVPYIIDFDTAYPADAIPAWDGIGGSGGYQSPEVLIYGLANAPIPKDPTTITYATDIFSLAIVFHRWWTRRFPEVPDGCRKNVGIAAYYEREILLDKKFDVAIGPNHGATLLSLLNWMLAKDPTLRPTAKEVLTVLKDECFIPEKYHKGNDAKPFDTEVWADHKCIATLLSPDELRAEGLSSLHRVKGPAGSSDLRYHIKTIRGAERDLTILELCKMGFATSKNTAYDEPWESHMIKLAPPEVLLEKGVISIKRIEVLSKNVTLLRRFPAAPPISARSG